MRDMGIEEFLREGIEKAKSRYWSMLVPAILFSLAAILLGISVIGLLLVPAVFSGYLHFMVASARGHEPSFSSSFLAGFRGGLYWKSLIINVLMIAGLYIGFLLLLVPGVYLGTVLVYAPTLLVDKKVGVVGAMQISRVLVHKQGFWKILGTNLILTVIGVVLGTIFVTGVGIVVSVLLAPFMAMILVAMYENAISADDEGEGPALESKPVTRPPSGPTAAPGLELGPKSASDLELGSKPTLGIKLGPKPD